ncbi:unnamed protein product, partial [Heterotrigona itama]
PKKPKAWPHKAQKCQHIQNIQYVELSHRVHQHKSTEEFCIRFIENLKVWKRLESKRLTIQCYCCQAHTSTNCNKRTICVKCGAHDRKDCTKTLRVPLTCANYKENHSANYAKCLSLLTFLAKKKKRQTQQQTSPTIQSRSFSNYKKYTSVASKTRDKHTCAGNETYANVVARQSPSQRLPTPPENN